MKKCMLMFFVMFLSLLNVDASSAGGSEIEIEGIELISKKSISYNEVLEIEYQLVPRDTDQNTIFWNVIDLIDGVTADFVDGNLTTSCSGTVKIRFKNDTDESVKVRIIAENKENEIKEIIEVQVNDKIHTEKLLSKAVEIEEKIISLPKEITSENYSEVTDLLEQIESLFYLTETVEEFVSEDLIEKYEFVIKEVNDFEEEKITIDTIIIIILLMLSFIFGLIIIFKKEK